MNLIKRKKGNKIPNKEKVIKTEKTRKEKTFWWIQKKNGTLFVPFIQKVIN